MSPITAIFRCSQPVKMLKIVFRRGLRLPELTTRALPWTRCGFWRPQTPRHLCLHLTLLLATPLKSLVVYVTGNG